MSYLSVQVKRIAEYRLFLVEPSRPPSKGGNTSACHRHTLLIEGESYSFRALGSQQWVFKTDCVSFDYETNGSYRNIVVETIKTTDRHGNPIVRGNRGKKQQLRTTPTRPPVSRREQRK